MLLLFSNSEKLNLNKKEIVLPECHPKSLLLQYDLCFYAWLVGIFIAVTFAKRFNIYYGDKLCDFILVGLLISGILFFIIIKTLNYLNSITYRKINKIQDTLYGMKKILNYLNWTANEAISTYLSNKNIQGSLYKIYHKNTLYYNRKKTIFILVCCLFGFLFLIFIVGIIQRINDIHNLILLDHILSPKESWRPNQLEDYLLHIQIVLFYRPETLNYASDEKKYNSGKKEKVYWHHENYKKKYREKYKYTWKTYINNLMAVKGGYSSFVTFWQLKQEPLILRLNSEIQKMIFNSGTIPSYLLGNLSPHHTTGSLCENIDTIIQFIEKKYVITEDLGLTKLYKSVVAVRKWMLLSSSGVKDINIIPSIINKIQEPYDAFACPLVVFMISIPGIIYTFREVKTYNSLSGILKNMNSGYDANSPLNNQSIGKENAINEQESIEEEKSSIKEDQIQMENSAF